MSRFRPGMFVRFTYRHQDKDDQTGDSMKEILVLHPNWQNKVHALDLKRLTPAERAVLDAVLDSEQKDKPHRIPLVNDIKRKMDPIELIQNPIIFYTKFIKPFLRKKDAYRTYIERNMSGITVVKDASIKTGKKPVDKPLFGPKSPEQAPNLQPDKPATPGTAIDIMVAQQKAREGK